MLFFICKQELLKVRPGMLIYLQVWKVTADIGKNLNDYKVIVTKSTVPVGTNEKIKKLIKENLVENVDFDIVSNPEFLREGYSVEDMKNPDRTVIGSDSEKGPFYYEELV